MRRCWLLAAVLLASTVTGDPANADPDPARGERAFRQCATCHSFDPARRLQGPHLAGVIGRPAGSVEGFRYSRAMTQAGIVWGEDQLTAYLTNPRRFLPGTSMILAIRNPADIPDLLAFLQQRADTSPAP